MGNRKFIKGILRTLIVCGIGGLILYYTGQWPDRSWIIYSTAIMSIIYWAYKAYWPSDQSANKN
jgi:hypothetical protein